MDFAGVYTGSLRGDMVLVFTVRHPGGAVRREREKGGGGGEYTHELCNKELLAKQRTNVFSPQSLWWYLLCHTHTLAGMALDYLDQYIAHLHFKTSNQKTCTYYKV